MDESRAMSFQKPFEELFYLPTPVGLEKKISVGN
jgi:hypothetical protein